MLAKRLDCKYILQHNVTGEKYDCSFRNETNPDLHTNCNHPDQADSENESSNRQADEEMTDSEINKEHSTLSVEAADSE